MSDKEKSRWHSWTVFFFFFLLMAFGRKLFLRIALWKKKTAAFFKINNNEICFFLIDCDWILYCSLGVKNDGSVFVFLAESDDVFSCHLTVEWYTCPLCPSFRASLSLQLPVFYGGTLQLLLHTMAGKKLLSLPVSPVGALQSNV